MQKITTSENYYCGADCRLQDCERHYCPDHRLLYRDCDSAVEGWEGDFDVVNGTRRIWEVTGECPECVGDYRRKKRAEEIERWQITHV